ncbi:hypothetical protein SeLEV6574_g01847 [Synchytrium endobioticum]|uniref:Uncharacterized protein n=1 Tax=Synchytrium endobioticum TaxID=286115 RepID=A0A507DD25_9FUNG|nr:hypothetical protein SeLEV6574_g01847 [Synchytrium endobioticum]
MWSHQATLLACGIICDVLSGIKGGRQSSQSSKLCYRQLSGIIQALITKRNYTPPRRPAQPHSASPTSSNPPYVPPRPAPATVKLAEPWARQVYFPSGHKTLPPAYPRNERAGAWRSAIGVNKPDVVQAADAAVRLMLEIEIMVSSRWVLRYGVQPPTATPLPPTAAIPSPAAIPPPTSTLPGAMPPPPDAPNTKHFVFPKVEEDRKPKWVPSRSSASAAIPLPAAAIPSPAAIPPPTTTLPGAMPPPPDAPKTKRFVFPKVEEDRKPKWVPSRSSASAAIPPPAAIPSVV